MKKMEQTSFSESLETQAQHFLFAYQTTFQLTTNQNADEL